MDLDLNNLPRHLAIIMDGNGRWAESRGQPRIRGHQAGTESIREITEEAARLGIERLTLYSFSLENWRRPRPEVLFLMRLLKQYLIGERETLKRNDIRLTAIGRIDDLPRPVRRELERTIEGSASHTGLNLCLALSYGGRAEIVDACRSIAADVRAGRIEPVDIDQALISSRLYLPGPDPDLLIRTAGEHRLSNFLLWQLSYTEIVIWDDCWPDFRVPQLHAALRQYHGRVRKFGGLISGSEQQPPAAAARSDC